MQRRRVCVSSSRGARTQLVASRVEPDAIQQPPRSDALQLRIDDCIICIEAAVLT